MSDSSVYIPGVSNKYNSNEAIQKIMESKRVKLENLENDQEELKEKRISLNEIKKKALALQSRAKKLYGFESPFEDKVSLSSNKEAFGANVSRNAEIGEYKIEILNKATSHKIASKALDKKFKVSPRTYIFEVDKNKFRINFSGGTLDNLSDEIKKQSKNKLRSTVTWDTPKTQILVIETDKTGAKSYITFGDDKTKAAFKEMGFYEDVTLFDKNFKFGKSNFESIEVKNKKPLFKENNTVILNPNESFKYKLPEKIPYKEKLIFEIDIKHEKLDPDKLRDTIPTGPDYRTDGDIDIYGVHVEGERSLIDIPPYEKKDELVIVEDDHYFEIITDKQTIEIDELDINDEVKTISLNLTDLINKDENIEAVIFKNKNTLKKIELSNIRFYDEGSEKGVKFNNELSSSKDALLILDGIKIRRETNSIDDLIKGMTLYVFDKTKEEESLKIDRDYEKIIMTMTDFLKEYNEFLEMVNKKTSNQQDEEGNVGDFSGDYSFISLISRLRTTLMNAYPTFEGDEIAMLSQIGISTDISVNTGVNKDKLKGYLEADENKLLENIEQHPVGIKELFGRDNDGDLIIDGGIAFEVERLLKAYTGQGRGFFDTKRHTIDQKIDRKVKEIETYKEKLDDEEQKLKEKFYKMEKAAGELEESMKRFDNFNKNK